MEWKHYAREKIYEMVWSCPTAKVAKELGLSDRGLGKACERAKVPVPPRGYWQKLAAGEQVFKPALPPVDPEDAQVVVIKVDKVDPFIAGVLADPELTRLVELERLPEGKIVVPSAGGRHDLAKRVEATLKKAKLDDHGAVKCQNPELPYVRIAPVSIDRAVCVVDVIVKAVLARGWMLEPHGRSDGLAVHLYGEHLPVLIEERIRRQPHTLTKAEIEFRNRPARRSWSYDDDDGVQIPQWDFFPTGEFTLRVERVWQIEVTSCFRDSSATKVESRLNDLMVTLLRAAFIRRAQDARRAQEEAERRAAQAKRAAEEERIRHEQERLKQLETDAEQWVTAENLRAFVEAVERRVGANGVTPGFLAWREWALVRANNIDPITSAPLDRWTRETETKS